MGAGGQKDKDRCDELEPATFYGHLWPVLKSRKNVSSGIKGLISYSIIPIVALSLHCKSVPDILSLQA